MQIQNLNKSVPFLYFHYTLKVYMQVENLGKSENCTENLYAHNQYFQPISWPVSVIFGYTIHHLVSFYIFAGFVSCGNVAVSCQKEH